jgi:hypothetical protein
MKHFSTLLLALLIPSAAFAQASITGVVKDPSGAVLPGVTVEASSPALIEKARSVVTDGSGQYRIVTLPPGIYALTFTLSGFSTVKREGIELRGTFTAAIDAELRVGNVSETVTVTGETPLVDTQSATQQRVLGSEVVDAIPTESHAVESRRADPGHHGDAGCRQLVRPRCARCRRIGRRHRRDLRDPWRHVPGLAHDDQRALDRLGQRGVRDRLHAEHERHPGNRRRHLRRRWRTKWAASARTSSRRTAATSSPAPIYASYTNEHLTSNNVDADLSSRGLPLPTPVKVNGDFNPGFGGPIKRDTVWFYAAARYLRSDNYVAGVYVDTTQDDPNVFAYTPDLTHKAINNGTWKDGQGRVTWQANRLHKFAFSWSQQTSCKCPSLISPTQIGGTENRWGHPQRVITGDWTAPMTNRLLLDASILSQVNKWGFFPRDSSPSTLIGILEQANGMNLKTRPTDYRDATNKTLRYRFAVSYVTGAHAFKTGIVNSWAMADYNQFAIQPIRYRLNRGIPNQVIMRVRPYHDLWTLDAEPASTRRIVGRSIGSRSISARGTTTSAATSRSRRSAIRRIRTGRRASSLCRSSFRRPINCGGTTSRRRWRRRMTCSATARPR